MLLWVCANISESTQFQSKNSIMELRRIEVKENANCLANNTENNCMLILMNFLEILL